MEADWLINFAKLKTHRVGTMTCCVKTGSVYSAGCTFTFIIKTRLPKLVAELHRARGTLCFGDGIIVGEGRPGFVAPSFLGVLLVNDNPVAIDSIGSELLNVSRNELVFPWTAYF